VGVILAYRTDDAEANAARILGNSLGTERI
jgi:hypothetical protein